MEIGRLAWAGTFGPDERQLYGSPIRQAGFGQRVQLISCPDPTQRRRPETEEAVGLFTPGRSMGLPPLQLGSCRGRIGLVGHVQGESLGTGIEGALP